MYDHLYDRLDPSEVDVVVHADHPTLNRAVAERLAAGERLDLIATHSKYAPSQGRWLRDLTPLVDHEVIAPLAPGAVDLCRHDGRLLSLPRLIDVRVLWARADRVSEVPTTWEDLISRRISLGFPGRESGLFGTFFELVVGAGGALFDAEGRPTMDGGEAIEAAATLCRLAASAPRDLPSWHYDQVDLALLDGRVDAAGAWPGAWGAIRSSRIADRLEPHPYPAGPTRWVSYAGCHSWAIPTTCGDLEGARDLLIRLAGRDAHAVDAAGGSLCAHRGALADVVPDGPVDERRLAITRRTIDEAMITYPSLVAFPAIEHAGWRALNAALRGEATPAEAVARIQSVAAEVVGPRS
jgi:multiple sugar transport system substrate-binding protein